MSLPPQPLPAAADDSPASVTDLVFYATHELATDGVDARLFRHYSAMLREAKDPVVARLWVLLHHERDGLDDVRLLDRESAAVGGGVCRWSFGTLRRALPALASRTRNASAAYATRFSSSQGENYRRYFYFHASLLLWNMSFGHAYPRVKYYWRFEPDVLFNSRLNRLVELAAADDADLLLGNKYNSHLDRPDWPHFALNRHVLGHLPEKEWVFSLVSLSRLSRRFFHTMARRWTAGESAYEEVFLPMSCLPQDGCRRSSFHDIGRHRSAHSELVKFFRYIPCWRCLHFLGHADAQHHDDRVEIWHPVKRRACWLLYLDAGWKSKDVDATLLAKLDAEDVGCERNDSSWRAEGDAIPSAFTGEACYARRYPDVLADFCAGGVNTCKWSAIRDHWREHGKGEGRQFGCES